MANEIKMPQLSDTMDTGKILAWRKNEGDEIKRGDVLAEVETEKANLEIEAFQSGTLLKIVVPANTMAKVGEAIAYIGQPGEQIATTPSSGTTVTTPAQSALPPQQSNPTTAPADSFAPQASSTSNGSNQAAAYAQGDRIKASPLARKIALERNIDLSQVQGSGPEGRIVRKDIEDGGDNTVRRVQPALSVVGRSAHGSSAQGTSASTSSQYRSSSPSSRPVENAAPGFARSLPLSKMRETIARRMVESVTQAPHFYVTTSVEMGEAKRLYSVLKEKPEYKGISLNHLVIKAVAYGLENEPRVNYAMREGKLYQPEGINVGIITAIEDGLLIPVIKEANRLPLKDIVYEARAAVERARAGRPSSQDLLGGTFSISNMGMFDIENFTAIINPGQGGVLAVSSTKEQPVVRNGTLGVGLVMKATVSVDHRIIDGVMAANFLKFFKEALETPALLIV